MGETCTWSGNRRLRKPPDRQDRSVLRRYKRIKDNGSDPGRKGRFELGSLMQIVPLRISFNSESSRCDMWSDMSDIARAVVKAANKKCGVRLSNLIEH